MGRASWQAPEAGVVTAEETGAEKIPKENLCQTTRAQLFFYKPEVTNLLHLHYQFAASPFLFTSPSYRLISS